MAKKIIILEKNGGDFVSFKYLMWLDVPASRQSFYSDANKISSYKLASTQEIDLIRSGSIFEIVDEITVNQGSTVSDIQNYLIKQYNINQSNINSSNPWNRYGTYYDGTSWVAGGVS